MILSGVITLGHDAELKNAGSSSAVVQLNGAYNIGYGQSKRTQWASIALFGKQAESLSPYLLKGTKVDITARDVEVDQWTKSDGTPGVTLKGIAINVDLIGGQSNGQTSGTNQCQQTGQNNGQQTAYQNNQPSQIPQQHNAPNDFDDDDVPF